MSIVSDVSGRGRSDQRRQKLFAAINRASAWLSALGLGWLTPLLKIAAGDDPREQLGELRDSLVFPLMGIVLFLTAWAMLAPQVQTSLGAIPGPAQVWEQAGALWQDHVAEREKEASFYARQDERNAEAVAEGRPEDVKLRAYTGKPTFLDQILTFA